MGPGLPEQIVFSVDEAALSVRAVSYSLKSKLRTSEAVWPLEGLGGMTVSPEVAFMGTERIAKMVKSQWQLAVKFLDAGINPDQAIGLSPAELHALGRSLFCLGTAGLTEALRALRSGGSAFDTPEYKAATAPIVLQAADAAFTLFKELEPIGLSKKNANWRVWDRSPSTVKR